MKKNLLLVVGTVLFLISCTDMSVGEEEALIGELPVDFKWESYAKINKDVKSSQISFDINKKMAELKLDAASNEARKNCADVLLENWDLAGKIYTEYANCPRKGWEEYDKCLGEYAVNANYTIPVVKIDTTMESGTIIKIDTTLAWRCNIVGCSNNGWDEFKDDDQCLILEGKEYESFGCNEKRLSDVLKTALNNKTYTNSQFSLICRFVIPKIGSISNSEYSVEAIKYLNDFVPDSTLFKHHYFLLGRHEGRPYKYCEGEEFDKTKERNPELAMPIGSSTAYINDYSQHLFCLDTTITANKTDWKIYKVEEKK